jgi:dipeptidyl aminopeptidase/acylaminoacyl peptidase
MKRLWLMGAAALCVVGGLTGAAVAQAPAPAVVKSERGQLMLENVPATPPEVRERLQQYVNTRGAGFQDFTPDGGILISTRFGDAGQIHKVDMPMGMRRQLTFFNEPVGGASVRPGASGQWLFSKDQGGDEYFQGFLFDPTAGRATTFTEPKTRNQGATWRDDGQLVAWARATADSPDYDIMVANPSDASTRRVLLKGKGAIGPVDFSNDGKTLLLSEGISVTKSRLFTLDVASGKLTELTPELNVAYDGGEFTKDGTAIVTISDEGSEFARLTKLDLATGARTVLTPDLGWDVEGFDLAPDGRTLAYVINVGGAAELKLMDLQTRRTLPAPALPPGVIGGIEFDDASSKLGFTLNSATAPSDVYIYGLKDKKLTRWTASEVGGLDPAKFVAPTLARYATFDSAAGGPKEITSWVYKPKDRAPTGVIVSIHGGPEAQSRPTFSSTIQYWVNELGLAVVLPNVRGSTGYGKTFVGLDNGFKRLDSVKDIGATLDWIDAQPDLKGKGKIVYGGSYGGYMVYASMIMYPERFAAGVDIVGISHFRTFLENTKGYRRDLRRVEYGDERDPAMAKFFEEMAPLNNAAKIKRPMFVVHGANDPRVPVSEAEQMVKAFRGNGLETWVMIAKDEGHGFAKKPNQEAQREAETLFFQKVLGLK